jgi:putative DNA-invertase from lambdoid prophage Rac
MTVNSSTIVFAYLRVSTDKQTVENQRNQITEYAKLHNYTIPVDGWFQDDATHGWIPALEREGFTKMIEYLQHLQKSRASKVPKYVLVYELSRIGRTFFDSIHAVEAVESIAPLMPTSPREQALQQEMPAMRHLMLSIMLVFAEMELEHLKDRTREGLARAKREGRIKGHAPTGYEFHNCVQSGHDPRNCAKRGKYFTTAQGKLVWDLLKMAKENGVTIRPVQVAEMTGLSYKKAYDMINSVQEYGLIDEDGRVTKFQSEEEKQFEEGKINIKEYLRESEEDESLELAEIKSFLTQSDVSDPGASELSTDDRTT